MKETAEKTGCLASVATNEITHCLRRNGTERAWFRSREEAEAFALDPVNTLYHGDVAHLCDRCGFWHLSRLEWLYGPLPETPEKVM